MSTNPNVFVCGATGSQGGAVAHQLRKINWTVHTTVRNPKSPVAQSLEEIGVQLTSGDWDDIPSLKLAMAGCDKLFLCSMPDFNDFEREKRQVEGIIAVAKAAGVTQVVLSTSLGVSSFDESEEELGSDTFMAKHLKNKKELEIAVSNAGFKHWTFLRPSFFMANFLEPKISRYPEPRTQGTWTTAMTPETLLPLIDHQDIASFAIAAFKDPEKYHNRAFGMASELLTVQDTLGELSKVTGRSLKPVFMTEDEILEQQKKSNVFVNSQVSMRYMSKYINMDEINSVIQPTSFKAFLEREKKTVKESYP